MHYPWRKNFSYTNYRFGFFCIMKRPERRKRIHLPTWLCTFYNIILYIQTIHANCLSDKASRTSHSLSLSLPRLKIYLHTHTSTRARVYIHVYARTYVRTRTDTLAHPSSNMCTRIQRRRGRCSKRNLFRSLFQGEERKG